MANEINISHSDHLQLLFDYKIKREGGTANTSQLIIELDSPISSDDLKNHLLSNPLFNQLVRTKLIRNRFRKDQFRFNVDQALEFEEKKADSIHFAQTFHPDDIGWKPLKITLIQLPSKSAILLQVNHVFIDNNGVKNLLRSFKGEQFEFHRSLNSPSLGFFKRLRNGMQFTKMMMTKWREPIAHIPSTDKRKIQKNYHIHDFNLDETNLIKTKIKRSSHIQSMSSVLMAASCLAVKDFLLQKGEKLHKFAFQQPSELTSKKEPRYILGNRFSFIFYRLKPEEITSIAEIQDNLNRQTMHQMKNKIVAKSLDLQSILRALSLKIHYAMINLPARGKMTTFAYTFIDESKIIDEFAGKKITNMINIPPVMKNPPITFGSMYYDGKLRVEFCYDENSMTSADIQTIIDSFKAHLLK